MIWRSANRRNAMTLTIEGISVPDRKVAREATELVRDIESPLLFHHSRCVYYWGALTGKRRGLHFDREFLYAGAMFHDMGLTPGAGAGRSGCCSRRDAPRVLKPTPTRRLT
jgi:hypothetical protein